MSATQRRYRVRIAERGASEVDGYVEFTLELGDLAEPPVVQGSLVHPLDGATELRPLTVLGIDRGGQLIAAFTDNQRWSALGRLCDLQWQEVTDGGSSTDWVTYGVGRVSGLDEQDGPGLFRIEISDETYAARRGVVFQHADTTQLWPPGLRWIWRGIPKAPAADGARTSTSGDAYRIELSLQGTTTGWWRFVSDALIDWIDDQLLPDGGDGLVNFQHLRLRYPDTDGHLQDWGVIGFAADSAVYSLETLRDPEIENEGNLSLEKMTITCWVLAESGMTPATSGDAYLYAPTAPPSSEVRLHLGVASADHPYGNDAIYPLSGIQPLGPGNGPGYLHIADLTRRVWQELGLRFDDDALSELEEDLSFPAMAPIIDSLPEDPHKWLQQEVWGPNGLLALRDRQGRMKLVDIRPPAQDADLSDLPLLDASNSAEHRWRLLGREQMNSVTWEYVHYAGPFSLGYAERRAVEVGEYGIYYTELGEPGTAGLDTLVPTDGKLGPIEPDDIDLMPHRPRTFSARSGLEPLGVELGTGVSRDVTVWHAARGSRWTEAVGGLTEFLLDAFQDGAMRGQCEIKGSLADTLDEGSYVLVDCASVKVANPGVADRSAKMLVLLLSLTRYPTHAEAEYLVLRPADVFFCPKEDDSSTWLVSPLGVASSVRLALGAIGEPEGDGLGFEIRARKNATGGDSPDMTVRLLHGETLLQEWTESAVDGPDWTVFSFDVDDSVLAQISGSSFDDLALEIVRGGTISLTPIAWRRLEISRISGPWTEIEVAPDSTDSSEPAGPSFSSELLALSPAVCWPLHDDPSAAPVDNIVGSAEDITPHARDGLIISTSQGAITLDDSLVPNHPELQSMSFPGTDIASVRHEYASADWITAGGIVMDSFTCAFAYMPRSFAAQRDICGVRELWQLWQNTNGTLTAQLRGTVAWTAFTSDVAQPLTLNEAVFVVIRLDGDNDELSIWVDGVKIASGTYTGPLRDPATFTSNMGRLQFATASTADRYMNCRGQFFTYWPNVALTDEQIANLNTAFYAPPGGDSSDAQLLTASLLVEDTTSCPVGDNFHVTYTASGLQSGDQVRVTAIKSNSEENVLQTTGALENDTLSYQWGMRTVDVEEGGESVSIWALVELLRGSEVLDHRVTNIAGPYNIEDPATCPGDFN